jgi:hypothetical protein
MSRTDPLPSGWLSRGHPYYARMPDIQELVTSIDGRLAEAKKEIVSLEAALASLSGQPRAARTSRATKSETSSPRASPPPSRLSPSTNGSAPEPQAQSPKPARKERAKSAKRLVPAGKLEVLLGASEGVTTASLAEHASGDRNQVLSLLRELEAAGRVRRSGERRGTRWHLITDEDRIAARAAELESQSKRTRARKN